MKKQRSREERLKIVKHFEKSGLTVKDYAEQIGIGFSTLQSWKKQAKEQAKEQTETKIPKPRLKKQSDILVIEVGGIKIRFKSWPDPKFTADIIKQFASPH